MPCVYSLNHLITKIDFFGQRIELNIQNETKSKTLLGGLLSIIMILSLFSLMLVQSQDILNQTNPKISIENIQKDISTNITLNNLTFPISFTFTGNTNLPINLPRYFKFYAKSSYGDSAQPELNSTELNIIFCKKDNFPLISENVFNSMKLQTYFYIENQNVDIKDSFSENYISYLSIGLKMV